MLDQHLRARIDRERVLLKRVVWTFARTRMTDSQMMRVMRKLEDAKLVAQTGGDWIGYVPSCDPDRISVEEVVVQMEGVQRLVPDIGPDDRERAVIGDLFFTLNQCTASALDRMSIGRVVRELYAPREVREEDAV